MLHFWLRRLWNAVSEASEWTNLITHFCYLTVKTSAQHFLGSSCKHSMAFVFGLSLRLAQLHPHILLSFSGLPFFPLPFTSLSPSLLHHSKVSLYYDIPPPHRS